MAHHDQRRWGFFTDNHSVPSEVHGFKYLPSVRLQIQRKSLWFLFAFCIAVLPLQAASIDSEEEKLAREWRDFCAQLCQKSVTPENRIKALERWQIANKKRIDAITANKRKHLQSANSSSLDSSAKVSRTPGMSDEQFSLLELQSEIGQCISAINATDVSPEERIRLKDEFIAINQSALQAERDLYKKIRREQKFQKATEAVSTNSQQIANPAINALIKEKASIITEIRETLDKINQLEPARRISEIDNNQAFLNKRISDLENIKKKISSTANSKQ